MWQLVGPLLRLLLAGCHGYLLVSSLIAKGSNHQFFLTPVPKLIVMSQLMAGIRCYAYLFFEISCLLLEISVGGVGLWQGIFPYVSYIYKDIQIETFEYEIEYDFVHSGTRALDRICYFIIPLLKTVLKIWNLRVGKHILAEIQQSFPGHMLDNNTGMPLRFQVAE